MFEKQYSSSDSAKNEALRPIIVNMGIKKAIEVIENYLKENDYEDIKVNNDYYEAFAVKDKFEYTFILVNNVNATVIIKVLAYTEATFGGAKGAVKKANTLLKELFKDKIK